jgi:TP901-1 family phage major tail protein
MAAEVGRKFLVIFDDNGSAVVAGVRTRSVSINRNPVDITNDDDDGWRGLLAEAGEKQLDISIGGVIKDKYLRAAAMDDSATPVLQGVTLEYPDGDTITGDFFLTTYSESASYNEAITFEASLQSTGVVAYTAGT